MTISYIPMPIPIQSSAQRCEHLQIEKYEYCPKCGDKIEPEDTSGFMILAFFISIFAVAGYFIQMVICFSEFIFGNILKTSDLLIELIPGMPIWHFIQLCIERW